MYSVNSVKTRAVALYTMKLKDFWETRQRTWKTNTKHSWSSTALYSVLRNWLEMRMCFLWEVTNSTWWFYFQVLPSEELVNNLKIHLPKLFKSSLLTYTSLLWAIKTTQSITSLSVFFVCVSCPPFNASVVMTADHKVAGLFLGVIVKVRNDGSLMAKLNHSMCNSLIEDTDESKRERQCLVFILPRGDDKLWLGGVVQPN